MFEESPLSPNCYVLGILCLTRCYAQRIAVFSESPLLHVAWILPALSGTSLIIPCCFMIACCLMPIRLRNTNQAVCNETAWCRHGLGMDIGQGKGRPME